MLSIPFPVSSKSNASLINAYALSWKLFMRAYPVSGDPPVAISDI